jgi:hypothetical protein
MTRDPIARRRSTKVLFGVLAVGVITSALVAFALIYLGQMRLHF